MSCPHLDFAARVDVHRITRVEAGAVAWFQADVRIECTACHLPFRFIGLPSGLDMNGAAVSLDGFEARLAIAPKGEVLTPTEGAVSFTVRRRP